MKYLKSVIGLLAACTLSSGEEIIREEFNSLSELEQSWYISTWGSSLHQYSRENVTVDNGILTLKLNGSTTGEKPDGGEITYTKRKFLYGSYRASIKTTDIKGSVIGWFVYQDGVPGDGKLHEVDMEILTEKSEEIHFTLHHDAYSVAHDVMPLGFDPSKDFHEYRFDWYPDSVAYYIDSVHFATQTTNIPDDSCSIMLNHWSKNNPYWGGVAPTEDTWMYVDYMHYVPFDTSGSTDTTDTTKAGEFNVPASTQPPGGLAVTEVPVFVNIGWDDNSSVEGIAWSRTLFDDRKNADGSKALTSYYMNSLPMKNDIALRNSVNDLLNSDHELGNHTWDHQWHVGQKFDPGSYGTTEGWNGMVDYLHNATFAQWDDIIARGEDSLFAVTDVTMDAITGFRSPFLEYGTNLLPVLSERGYKYDCSIGEFSDGNGVWNWPYTLDNGSPAHNKSWKNNPVNPESFTVPQVPGLWELPVYELLIPDDATCPEYNITPGLRGRIQENISWMTPNDIHITGFDYNLWGGKKLGQAELDSTEVVGLLKYNLDLRLQNNRAPFLFGAHSQYYVGSWAATNAPRATAEQMKGAINEFIAYALSKSEVRVVTAQQIVDWMENPTKISDGVANVPVATKTSKAVQIQTLSAQELAITVPDAGVYTVGIYSITGRKLYSQTADLTSGSNSVQLNNTLSNGVYLLRVYGNRLNHAQKAIIK